MDPKFQLDNLQHVKYPVWVEFSDLPPLLIDPAKPLRKVLGVKPVYDINYRWRPKVLVELDLSTDLLIALNLVQDDGVEYLQKIFYKYLPNVCFHYVT